MLDSSLYLICQQQWSCSLLPFNCCLCTGNSFNPLPRLLAWPLRELSANTHGFWPQPCWITWRMFNNHHAESQPKPITLECSEVGPQWFPCVAKVESWLGVFSLESVLHTGTEVFFLKLKLDYVWFPVQKSINDFLLPLEKFFSVLYKPFFACYRRPFMIVPP